MKYQIKIAIASCTVIGVVLALGSVLEPMVSASRSAGNSETNLDQHIGQDQKCKIGEFGDPDDSSSTVAGLCNQQAQNSIDSGSSLGDVGISN